MHLIKDFCQVILPQANSACSKTKAFTTKVALLFYAFDGGLQQPCTVKLDSLS